MKTVVRMAWFLLLMILSAWLYAFVNTKASIYVELHRVEGQVRYIKVYAAPYQ